MHRWAAAAGLGGIAAGLLACVPAGIQAPGTAPAAASALGHLRVAEAGAARALQATETAPLVPFTKSRLSRIEVFLEDLQNELGPQRSHDLLPSQFNGPLRFDGLVEGGSYRVTMRAWQPANVLVPAGLQLEAQADEASSLSFGVPPFTPLVDLDEAGGLVLALKDRDAALAGAGGIQLQPGVIQNPAASEALVP